MKRYRVAFIACGSVMGLFACNALTGIGDYAVGDQPASDASTVDAATDTSAAPDANPMVIDAGSDACALPLNDHTPLTTANCTESVIGPKMTSAVLPGGRLNCIDETEVTVEQYNVFLGERGPNMCGQPAECAWNETYSKVHVDDTATAQTNVDWCDAFMYCRWAGKQLCGTLSGPENTPGNVTGNGALSETVDTWFSFCTATGGTTGALDFYGSSWVAGRCVDHTFKSAFPLHGAFAPGSAPGCHGVDGGVAQDVYDMSGNLGEWEWSCSVGDDSAFCGVRGGDYTDDGESPLYCEANEATRRDAATDFIGFRCCVQ